MSLLDRLSERAALATIAESMKRIADAFERAHPPASVVPMTVEAIDDVLELEPVPDESEGMGDAEGEADFLRIMHRRMQEERDDGA